MELPIPDPNHEAAPAPTPLTWLLLIHQIPPKPSYFRVKIWRRLQRLGALGIKNTVYALPLSDQAQEDFQWVLREIVSGGGDASLLEARFLDGLDDSQIVALFQEARRGDYAQLAEDARKVLDSAKESIEAERQLQLEAEVAKLKRRLGEISGIDFFSAPDRETAAGLISGLEQQLKGETVPAKGAGGNERFTGRTWVTRAGVQVDRIASAWLIRRFIDPKARFKYVPPRGYQPESGELRFDMFDAEYTHEGEDCSFEVLLRRLGPEDPALRPIAEIIHDIDVKDGKFGRSEVAGFERMLAAIALHPADDERLARGSALLDDLYELFKRTPA